MRIGAVGGLGWVMGVGLSVALAACVDRGTNLVDVGSSGPDDEDVGMRPADGMFGPCGASDECEPLEFCVFPAGEAGFCTDRCATPTDPDGCDPSPGGSAVGFCLDIGLPDGDRVCALDCAGGKSCPGGMRCEGIETADGEERVCF